MSVRQALVHALAALLSTGEEQLTNATPTSIVKPLTTITQTVTTTVTALASTSPTQATLAIEQECANFRSMGCWLEGSTPTRLLPDDFVQDENSMTIEVCSTYCSNYTLFGVEYGSECFCANAITENSGFPIGNEHCQFPCSGNDTEMCGGTGALNMFQNTRPQVTIPPQISNFTYASAGCWSEPADGSRALDGYVNRNPSNSVDSCSYICGLSNFTYFGLEYGTECWCGNEVSPSAVKVDDSKCDVACPGSKNETCGGGLLLNLYNGTYGNSSTFGSGGRRKIHLGL